MTPPAIEIACSTVMLGSRVYEPGVRTKPVTKKRSAFGTKIVSPSRIVTFFDSRPVSISRRLTRCTSASPRSGIVAPPARTPSFGCRISTSPPACGVVEPACASASMSDTAPESMYLPGVRTSPITNTLWLRNCSTSTVTCGLRR